ncbi:MAG TPA: PspC domain-containing protein [Chloroflexota bacterium]|nr:PspC domain-containing protein [Chloroflexota bacterium]
MAGPEPSGRRRLRRSRNERLLFGVAGGVAEYFEIDPALVRIGFVLAGIFPPTSAISVIGYLLLTVILPEADAEELAGRDQLRRNLQDLRTEVEQMSESVRSNLGMGGAGASRERETVDLSDVEVTDVTVPSERSIERAAEYPPERPAAASPPPSPPSAAPTGTTSGVSGASNMPGSPGPSSSSSSSSSPGGPSSAGTATKAPSASADGPAESAPPPRP